VRMEPGSMGIHEAAFVLHAAAEAGIRLGTNGEDLLVSPPRAMPKESWHSFERAIFEHRDAIIQLIMEEQRA
jgi:hypothetical protein